MNADKTKFAYRRLSAFIGGPIILLPVSVTQHPLPATPAELRALHVQPLHGVAGRHHAAPVRAMPQSERVSQFVSGLFHQPLAQQLFPRAACRRIPRAAAPWRPPRSCRPTAPRRTRRSAPERTGRTPSRPARAHPGRRIALQPLQDGRGVVLAAARGRARTQRRTSPAGCGRACGRCAPAWPPDVPAPPIQAPSARPRWIAGSDGSVSPLFHRSP